LFGVVLLISIVESFFGLRCTTAEALFLLAGDFQLFAPQFGDFFGDYFYLDKRGSVLCWHQKERVAFAQVERTDKAPGHPAIQTAADASKFYYFHKYILHRLYCLDKYKPS
jgi:hypothetical protein